MAAPRVSCTACPGEGDAAPAAASGVPGSAPARLAAPHPGHGTHPRARPGRSCPALQSPSLRGRPVRASQGSGKGWRAGGAAAPAPCVARSARVCQLPPTPPSGIPRPPPATPVPNAAHPILADEVLELEHDARARRDGRVAPRGERVLGGRNRRIKLGRRRQRQLGQHVLRRLHAGVPRVWKGVERRSRGAGRCGLSRARCCRARGARAAAGRQRRCGLRSPPPCDRARTGSTTSTHRDVWLSTNSPLISSLTLGCTQGRWGGGRKRMRLRDARSSGRSPHDSLT